MDDEFGPAYARVLASSLALTQLGGDTAETALKRGVRPKQIWLEVCAMQDVPVERQLGRDIPTKE